MPTQLRSFDLESMNAHGRQPGWVAGADGHEVGNPKVRAHLAHVMHVNEKGEPVYDQYLLMEQGGGMFLPVDVSGHIGLQKMWRMQTPNQETYAKNYPAVDFGSLGRASWEIPGGFAKHGETGAEAAHRESQEETGTAVVFQEELGLFCSNKAFNPHLVMLTWGLVDPARKPVDKPDPNEVMLAKLEWFSINDLAPLQAKGELYEGGTLAAIALMMMKHPKSLLAKQLR